MFSDFSDLSFKVHKLIKGSGSNVSRGHIQQLLAALLGYKSLAALQASSEEQPGIEGADHVIVDIETARLRVIELGIVCADPADFVSSVIGALRSVTEDQVQVHNTENDFLESVVIPEVDHGITDEDSVSSEMAMTNAYTNSVWVEPEEPEPLRDEIGDTWSIAFSGVVEMDHDPDKVFHGDRVKFDGSIQYQRVGRVCLYGTGKLDVGASIDRSYYEDDDGNDMPDHSADQPPV